jgi:hypothetical protein
MTSLPRTIAALLAAATMTALGCAGDSDPVAPTTPDELPDATIDGAQIDDVLFEDTTDAGVDVPPLDTSPDDAGDDVTTTEVTTTEASSDAGDDVAVDVVAEVVAEVAVDSAVADAPIESGDAGKVCLPALTTSSKGACDATTQSWPDEGANHFEPGTALTYCTSPPSSGDHYSAWAAYRIYDKPVPYGYLVHSLEHGAVVILYKCASGSCPTVQSDIAAVVNARPVDPLCTDPIKRRVIVAPDPTLDIAIGASAWGWTYRATCVNAATLNKFIDDHYAKTTEDFCGDGVIPP